MHASEGTTFGERLRYYRKQCKEGKSGNFLSQLRFANLLTEELGMPFSRNQVGVWELNKQIISPQQRAQLLGIIKVLTDSGGISTPIEANDLLESGGYKPLAPDEVTQINERWLETRKGVPTGLSKGAPQNKWIHNQFALIMADKTRDFEPRDHLFFEMDKFLEAQPNGYLSIVGDPGVGKTALLANYAKRNDLFVYFNSRSQAIDRTSHFVMMTTWTLNDRYGLHQQETPEDSAFYSSFLTQLVQDASASLAKGERLVLLVDALDEVNKQDIKGSQNILSLPEYLPDGVYFILSQRNTLIPLRTAGAHVSIKMMDFPEQNRKDVLSYLSRRSKMRAFQRWIQSRQLDESSFLESLADRSNDNFMYLHQVLLEIENGIYQNANLEDLPTGLQAYYEDHWTQMGMRTNSVREDDIQIVYYLCEARQPVSRALLAKISQLNEVHIQKILSQWQQFLHAAPASTGELRYSLYHSSFRDFLRRKDIVQAAGIDLNDIKKNIAASLLEAWESLRDDH